MTYQPINIYTFNTAGNSVFIIMMQCSILRSRLNWSLSAAFLLLLR